MSTKIPPLKPNIFEYRDYRQFLQDLYDHLKQTTDFFSYRYFSKKAGFKSPNYLKLVLEGQRNISEDSIEKFASALKFSKDEKVFFAKLVAFNQARNNSERAAKAIELMQSKIYREMNPLQKDQLEYYSRWYYIGVRELTLCENFQDDPQWIANQFLPKIKLEEAEKALDALERLGLLGREPSGKRIPTDTNVATGDEVTSSFVALYHKEMMKMAMESIDRIHRDQREISSVCVPLSENTFLLLKQRIQEMRKELMAIADSDKSPQRVYQMNF